MTYFECMKEVWNDFTVLGKIVLFPLFFLAANFVLAVVIVLSPLFMLGLKFDGQLRVGGEKIKRLFFRED